MFVVRLRKTDLSRDPARQLGRASSWCLQRPGAAGDIAAMRAQMDRAVAAQELAQAEVWAKRILDAYIAQYGHHGQVGMSYYNWGNRLHAIQRHKEAVDAFRRSIAIMERTKGPNDILVGRASGNLGLSLSTWQTRPGGRRPSEGARHLQDHATAGAPHVANTLTTLGLAYNAQPSYDQAFALWEQAMEMYQRLEGPGSANVGRMINNIGSPTFIRSASTMLCHFCFGGWQSTKKRSTPCTRILQGPRMASR